VQNLAHRIFNHHMDLKIIAVGEPNEKLIRPVVRMVFGERCHDLQVTKNRRLKNQPPKTW